MPLYNYKAVDKTGVVVSNRVEEINKLFLLRKLKKNGFMPIEIKQIRLSKKASKIRKRQKKRQRKNELKNKGKK